MATDAPSEEAPTQEQSAPATETVDFDPNDPFGSDLDDLKPDDGVSQEQPALVEGVSNDAPATTPTQNNNSSDEPLQVDESPVVEDKVVSGEAARTQDQLKRLAAGDELDSDEIAHLKNQVLSGQIQITEDPDPESKEDPIARGIAKTEAEENERYYQANPHLRPQAEEEPPADPAPPAEPEPAPEEESSPDPEDDHAKRYRVKARTPVGQEMFRILKENPDMDEATALTRARSNLGVVEPAATPPPANPEPEAVAEESPLDFAVPDSVEGINAKIRELNAEYKKQQFEELDFEKAGQLYDQIDYLRDQIPVVEQRTAAADQAFADSCSKAEQLYPDSGKEGTPLYNRILEISKACVESNDPLANHPNRALIYTQMAAADLSIAPRSPSSASNPSPQAQPSPKPQPSPSSAVRPPARVPSATGVPAKQTAAPTPPTKTASEQTIDEINELVANGGDSHDLDMLKMRLLGRAS